MDYMQTCFKKSTQIVERVIDDEVILVPVVSSVSTHDSIFNLDYTGAKIWQIIDGRHTVADIRDYLVQDMDVTSAQAEADLKEFLNDLLDIGAIEEVKKIG